MKLLYIMTILFLIYSIGISTATDIYIDQEYVNSYQLDTANANYYLLNDSIANGTAFIVKAHNITFNGNYNTVLYANSTDGMCFNNTGQYNNMTIINTIMLQTNNSISDSKAVSLYTAPHYNITNCNITTTKIGIKSEQYSHYGNIINNTIESNEISLLFVRAQNTNCSNNTIKSTNADVIDLSISSNNNTFRNSTINATSAYYAIKLVNSQSDFINCSISSPYREFYLQGSADGYFQNIEMAINSKKIYSYDAIPLFKFSEDGTVIITSKGNAGRVINRKINNWNTSLYHWNDTIETTGRSMTYNVTNATPNAQYTVKIISNETTYNTDANGDFGFIHYLALSVDTGFQIYETEKPSFDYNIIQENRNNESYNFIIEFSNYSASLAWINTSWSGTESGNTYHWNYWNDTEISTQTAISDNETLWFNHTVAEIPEGKYYISETSTTIETFAVGVGAFAAVVFATTTVVSRRVIVGISGWINRRRRRR